MRSHSCITTSLAVLLLAGCEMPTFSLPICWDDFGCGSGWGIPSPSFYMIGFPTAKVDSASIAAVGGARGLLHIGDTVTLYVVSSVNFPNDTSRTVDWSADTTTSRISARADGGATLVATALGQVLVYTGNQGAAWSACDAVSQVFTCIPMVEIDVVP